MSHSDHNKSRHHNGHKYHKNGYNRKLRRIGKKMLDNAPCKLADFAAPGFCCGNHQSDWRY